MSKYTWCSAKKQLLRFVVINSAIVYQFSTSTAQSKANLGRAASQSPH